MLMPPLVTLPQDLFACSFSIACNIWGTAKHTNL